MPTTADLQYPDQQKQQPLAPPAPPAPAPASAGGGTHPLAELSPTAALFGGPVAGLAVGATNAATGADQPTAQAATNDKQGPGKDASGNLVLQTPEYVASHREQYGLTPDMDIKTVFREFVAHDLAYKQATKQVPIDPDHPERGTKTVSNYTPYEQAMLKAWGYSDKPQEVIDEKSGLYAARFNPLKGAVGPDGKPLDPTVAFRGTADLGGARADADSYIGASQYEPHKAEIAALMHADNGQKVDVTGHSLGGALAQKAAADNFNDVADVSTFSAPGIDAADADRFNALNRNGQVSVDTHWVGSDTVPRAGDERLAGKFYQNNVAGLGGIQSAPGIALANVMPSHTGYMCFAARKTSRLFGTCKSEHLPHRHHRKSYRREPTSGRGIATGSAWAI